MKLSIGKVSIDFDKYIYINFTAAYRRDLKDVTIDLIYISSQIFGQCFLKSKEYLFKYRFMLL